MRDDVYKASELVVYVSDMANEIYDGLVATVGKLNVSPNTSVLFLDELISPFR